MRKRITCAESDELRKGLSPWSSLTNYHNGDTDYQDPRFPAITSTEWCDEDEVVRLIDVLDANGCRHTLTDRVTRGVSDDE